MPQMENTQSEPHSAEANEHVRGSSDADVDLEDEDLSEAPAPSLALDAPLQPRRASQSVDLDLVRRARQADPAAFEALYRAWHRRIYNLIYQLVSNENDAVDLTQDVFVKLYETLPTLRADEAFVSFLYQMAVNLCRDHYRKRGRVGIDSIDQPRPGDDDDGPGLEIPDTSGSPLRALETAELQKRVQDALATLSEDHRTVIVLHHFQDMELTDIAKIMGCRVGTVKSRLARAREEMKRKLRAYMEP